MEINGFNWVMALGVLVVLAVGWTILRFVLRLTMQVFSCGCLALLVVVGGAFAWSYLNR